MKAVSLGDVCVARSSLVDPTLPENRDLPHIAPDTIERDTGRLLPYRTVAEDGVTSGKYRFEAGDLLYSKIRPNLNKVVRVHLNGLCSADMYALDVDRAKAVPEFLAHVLRGPRFLDFATSVSNRANIPKLNRAQLMAFEFTLPPLEEQRRIAAILDQADELRAKRRRTLTLHDDLTQSIFLDMFGNVIASLRLESVVDEFRYGTSNKSAETGDPALRIPNVVGGSIDVTDLKTVPVAVAEFARLQLREGDLLFVRTNGNPDNVGRCAVFAQSLVENAGHDGARFIYASYLIRARLDQSQIAPGFLAAFLQGRNGRKQLRDRSKTSAGQYNINIDGLSAVQVPEVPLELQHEFVRRVEAARAVRRTAEADQLDELFASLQARAFRGEL